MFQSIDLTKLDKFIVGDLCLGLPTSLPKGEEGKGEEGFVRHFDAQAQCKPDCGGNR